MNNYMPYIKASVIGTALFFSFLPVTLAAVEGLTESGKIDFDCTSSRSGLSDDYKNQVCIPLQDHAAGLLEGWAKAPATTMTKTELNLEQYAKEELAESIKSSEESEVNSPAPKSSGKEENIQEWNLQGKQ